LALASHLVWGNHKNIQADIEPIQSWIRNGLTSRWAALLFICGFVVLLSLSRALLMPPLNWDGLLYHLPLAALWIKKGTLLHFNAPDVLAECSHYPINGEIFASWLLLPFHNDLLVNTMNFPITLLGGITCYAIARELGLNRKEASWAPALICFAPVIYSEITTSQVDNAAFTFSLASILFLIRYYRNGHICDFLLSIAASGLLIGIKYTGIFTVGIILIVSTVKTIRLVRYSSCMKKLSLILLGILILCTLGGRQYIINTIEAKNPLYPFSVEIIQHEIFEGSLKWEQMGKWVIEYEKKSGLNKFNVWERAYRRFCYIETDLFIFPITAGPKFCIFFILALVSLFARPHSVSKSIWYLFSLMWIVQIILFHTDTAASTFRKGPFVEYSTRFLAPCLALFAIQGLIIIKKIRKHFNKIDYFLLTLVSWDLLYINKNHLPEIEVLYPFIIIVVFLIVIFTNIFKTKLQFLYSKEASTCSTFEPNFQVLLTLRNIFTRKWLVYISCFSTLVIGLYLLQIYRDNTRYAYYRTHTDYARIPRYFVNAWEFLDQPKEKNNVAMTMGLKLPSGNWFFYPLLGRWLQNDITYISAKYKREVPAWMDRGILRGNDYSTWLYNLKKKKVNYILVEEPWPIELGWLLDHKDDFQFTFNDKHFKIFKYIGDNN
jgi:hypothetical protein